MGSRSPDPAWSDLLARASELQVVGGAIYDALIGVMAQHAGEQLLTLDPRAVRTYGLLEVDHAVIG